jgi:mitogen-activated protein kinase 1/3
MAIDAWSVGCIFAELLAMQAESVRNPRDRRPLFPGRSCFPLSADNVLTVADQRDQLNVIFQVCIVWSLHSLHHCSASA